MADQPPVSYRIVILIKLLFFHGVTGFVIDRDSTVIDIDSYKVARDGGVVLVPEGDGVFRLIEASLDATEGNKNAEKVTIKELLDELYEETAENVELVEQEQVTLEELLDDLYSEPEQPEPASESEQPEPATEPEQPEPTSEPEQPEPTTELEQPEPTSESEQPEPTTEPEQPEPTTEPEQPEPTSEPEQPEPTTELAQSVPEPEPESSAATLSLDEYMASQFEESEVQYETETEQPQSDKITFDELLDEVYAEQPAETTQQPEPAPEVSVHNLPSGFVGEPEPVKDLLESLVSSGLANILPDILPSIDQLDTSPDGWKVAVGEVSKQVLVTRGDSKLPFVAKLQYALSFQEPDVPTEAALSDLMDGHLPPAASQTPQYLTHQQQQQQQQTPQYLTHQQQQQYQLPPFQFSGFPYHPLMHQIPGPFMGPSFPMPLV